MRPEAGHSLVAGFLVHGLYLGGVFIAISQGVPAGISALIPGLQPVLISTIANRFMGETVTRMQWLGLALGVGGVALVLHDRQMVAEGSVLGWSASFISLFAIALGTLYQKRFCGKIDWRSGNLVQYAGVTVLFTCAAFAFETRVIHWNGELIFAMAWLVLVLSVAGVGLMYWLIRRSAATGFASLFYLVPAVTALMAYLLFGEKLDALSIVGMVVCAVGVVLVNRGARVAACGGQCGGVGDAGALGFHFLQLFFFGSSTICVCVTNAHSRPSPRVMRVCQTMVERPRCSGVHSA